MAKTCLIVKSKRAPKFKSRGYCRCSLSVNTQTFKGEFRTLRNRRTVRTSTWKRAIVKVKPGERIEII